MGGVLAALITVFFEFDFVGDVYFIPIGNIVLGFTNATNESKYLTGTFFSHRAILYSGIGVCGSRGCDRWGNYGIGGNRGSRKRHF